jgi:hypothetical protein
MTPEQLRSQPRFEATIAYITRSDPTETGHQVKWVGTWGIFRAETAAIEMLAVARLSTHTCVPAKQLVITYPSGVSVMAAQARSDATHFLRSFGLARNQAVFALHSKHGVYNLHILYNVVRPDGRAARTAFLIPRMYACCAEVSLSRGWPIEPNRYNRDVVAHQPNCKAHDVKPSLRRTPSMFYSSERGELTWGEAVSYFIRPVVKTSQNWAEFLTNLSHRGLVAKFERRKYKNNGELCNLRYCLADYPHLGCSSSIIGDDLTYEALRAKWGEVEKSDLECMPSPNIGAAKKKTSRLYSTAGRVLEGCVADGTISVPQHERTLILARRLMRRAWLGTRHNARLTFQDLYRPAWEAEKSQRTADAAARRKVKRDRSIEIRTLPLKEREDQSVLLEWEMSQLRREHRRKAALRWASQRAALEARVPDINFAFPEFVRRRAAQGDKFAQLVREDHLKRGIAAPTEFPGSHMRPAERSRSPRNVTASNLNMTQS